MEQLQSQSPTFDSVWASLQETDRMLKESIADFDRILKKSKTFRLLFPQYKDFKIYLGLASMSFYPKLENEYAYKGIAVIEQVGDTVVINDAHLKVF